MVLGCALFGTADSALAQGREEFRKGIDLFEQGKYKDAESELEKVLAANPSAEVALEMRNEAGAQVFIEMLGRKGEPIATIARKLLELAERGEAKEQQDPEKIQALIQQMFSDDDETSFRAMEELASQVGPFCAPYMVEHLAERRDNDKRVKAILLLSKLGPDGTNAVCALLQHKDDFVRQNAAAILGHIRDFKAIPYLKALCEKRGESAHVQKEAALALKNITGKEASSLEPAIVYFHALGERYYQEDPTVMINNFKQWTVWEWKDDKLTYRIVPRYSWNDEMAQECCYLAIDHAQGEGDLDPIYTLLVSVFFQRALEVNELLAMAEEKGGAVDAADVEALKAAKAKVDVLPYLARSRGEAQVAKALRKALRDHRPTLAVSLIGALKELRMSETLLPADGANLAS
ncbi:MAG TPA: HEAT repeat domain-containing protein, partial [Planctomycetota bacterium]|nr:HEAT repeat domain-containing protein [Planctomycetota bacterium]